MASNINVGDLSKQWNSLSWEDQQAKLKANSKLQGALNELGLTVKSQPTTVNQNIAKTQGNNYPANNTSISSYSTSGSHQASSNASVGTGAVAGMNNNTAVNYSNSYPTEGYKTEDPKYTQYKTEDPRYSGYKTEDPKYANGYMSVNPKYANANQNQNQTTQPTNKGTTTVKSSSTNRATVTPQQQQWDYQDNSQARMDQIADNLNKYTQTNPDLFKDYDSFYNFFIAGKGRSEDQRRFLDNWYADYKKNEKYNNMSAAELGIGIANGTVPIDYLDYVKSKDPQKYNEIMIAKSEREQTIKNEGGLQTIVETMGGGDTDNLSWQKKEKVRMDEDDNGIDDRREHYASEEEKGYQKQIADLNARNLEIDNTIKNTYDDLRDRYPGAAKSTLMAMANDRNSDLMREKEDNLVELTRLQGYVGYMQAERKEMNEAGDNSIRQLQDNLKLYYTYSPTGMKELAEAQYEANNPTLANADNGTDLDKQRAVDAVITEYFDKYGDIIERPKTQVVQDALDYAKKNGVSLSDAINETFTKYLKAKPKYATIAAGGSTDGSWTLEPIKDAEGNIISYVKIDKNTGAIEGLQDYISGLGNGTGGYTAGTNGQYVDYTPVTQREMVQGLKDFMNSFVDENGYLTGKGGQCGKFVNDYLQSLGLQRLYTDPVDKKKAITNTNTPAIGAVAVMDSKNYPQYGHVAIVGKVNNDGTLTLLESNWGGDESIHIRENVDPSKVYGYFNPSIASSSEQSSNPAWSPMYDTINATLKKGKLTNPQSDNLQLAETIYRNFYDMAIDGSLDHFLNSSDWQNIMSKLQKRSFTNQDEGEGFLKAWNTATQKKYITDQDNLKVIRTLTQMIEKKLRKESGAAISSSEWLSNFENYLPSAGESYANKLSTMLSWEKNIIEPTMRYSGVSDYKWLFTPNSPYYKTEKGSSALKSTGTNTNLTNSKGTWDIGYSNQSYGNQYDDLFNELGY